MIFFMYKYQITMNTICTIQCPHCLAWIEIESINCAIFRHAVYKQGLTGINPHMSKIDCENLVNNDLVYGCGKPFKLIGTDKNGEYQAIICGYI